MCRSDRRLQQVAESDSKHGRMCPEFRVKSSAESLQDFVNGLVEGI